MFDKFRCRPSSFSSSPSTPGPEPEQPEPGPGHEEVKGIAEQGHDLGGNHPLLSQMNANSVNKCDGGIKEDRDRDMYDDYVSYCQKYKAAYGATTTVVAYEVGKFMTWYNCDKDLGCDVVGICECINVAVTRRNKNIPRVDRKNPMMGGVPRDAFFHKHLQVLLDADYTVVVVSQLTDEGGNRSSGSIRSKGSGSGGNGAVRRGVTDVISAGVCCDVGVSGGNSSHACDVNDGNGNAGAATRQGCPSSFGERGGNSNTVMALYGVSSSSTTGRGRLDVHPATLTDVGCAFVDLNTGSSTAFEVNPSRSDPTFARDETSKLVREFCPKEIVLCGKPSCMAILIGLAPMPSDDRDRATNVIGRVGDTTDDSAVAHLVEMFSRDMGVNSRCVRSRLTDDTNVLDSVRRVKFQEHTLKAVFPDTGFLSAIEALDLERRPHAAAAYVGLLQFVFEHNEHVLKDIPRPEVHTSGVGDEGEEALELTYNAAEQLDIVASMAPEMSGRRSAVSGKMSVPGGCSNGTLLGILDACCTAGGRRLFRKRLLHPSSDPVSIEARLDRVERYTTDTECLSKVRSALSNVRDLDRAFRRIALRRIEPSEFDILEASISSVMKAASACYTSSDTEEGETSATAADDVERRRHLLDLCEKERTRHAEVLLSNATRLCLQLRRTLDMSEVRKTTSIDDVRCNVFLRGRFPHIDELQDDSSDARRRLCQFVDHLNAKQGTGYFKVVQDDVGEAPSVVGTQIRCTAMKKAMANETITVTGSSSSPSSPFSFESSSSGGESSATATLHVSELDVQAVPSSSSSSTTNARIRHPILEEWGTRARDAEQSIRKLVRKEYSIFVDALWSSFGRADGDGISKEEGGEGGEGEGSGREIGDDGGGPHTRGTEGNHRSVMMTISQEASGLDVACTCAFNALRLRHNRPRFGSGGGTSSTVVAAEGDRLVGPGPSSSASSSSSLTCLRLRHPVVEALNTRVPHVANDVHLGHNDARGMLLYGMNAAGKSCLMKATALAVVMAQAGMFTACDVMRVDVPFRKVLTRIRSRDDIVRGQSTFMVEMSELRDILRRCDARSLVIGDEVCSGTESTSALAIVGASIRRLLARGAPFVFATHLHELPSLLRSMKMATPVDGLRVCHLRVKYDARAQTLVYDRKLCEGQGPTVYGLEVCKSLDMQSEFLDDAHAIRRVITGTPHRIGGEETPAKTSRYNAAVVMGMCGVCRSRQASETHHIAPQADADAEGYVLSSVDDGGSERRGIGRGEDGGGGGGGDKEAVDLRHAFHKNIAFNLVPLCDECHLGVHAGRLQILGYEQTSSGVRLRCEANGRRSDTHSGREDDEQSVTRA